jgi:hypothetical protein
MMVLQALARHRYLLQVCFIAAATTVCVLVTGALAFRSPANLAWMIGLPVAVGMAGNVGWWRECFMAMALAWRFGDRRDVGRRELHQLWLMLVIASSDWQKA